MKKYLLFVILFTLSGCCKKQYNNFVETSHLEKINTIDTYNYKGITTIYYDTTVIIIEKETGDTLKETKSKNKITINDNIQNTDTNNMLKNDSVQYITQTIVTNELNQLQKTMMTIGIMSLIFIIIFIAYKILKFFKK